MALKGSAIRLGGNRGGLSLSTGRTSLERGNMGNGLLAFIYLASLAVVVWAIVDVARSPAVALALKWKALWIAGMFAAWFLLGAIGAIVSVFYLAGPRRRLNTVEYSGRHRALKRNGTTVSACIPASNGRLLHR